MKRKPLIIGNLVFEAPFVLAPLAGITDRSMRSLCSQAGASLTFTEMVSAKGLWYGDRRTGELLAIGPDEGPVGYQLFGCEPEILGYAVRILADPERAGEVDAQMGELFAATGRKLRSIASRPPMGARTIQELYAPALFDLNAGCPVPKIVKNGEGSALLKDPQLLHDCVAAMVKASGEAAKARARAAGGVENLQVPKPVTVKIRKGFEADDDCAVEIARAAEAAGAAAITVHGRTRQQYYDGAADWDVIARVKAAVKIPVIGNGDVRNGEDALRMMEETGCDGVMIARGALGNPWIFREAVALWRGEKTESTILKPTATQRIDLLLRHLDMICEDKGEKMGVREIRKHIAWYTRGIRGAASVRREANGIDDVEALKRVLRALAKNEPRR